MQLNNMTFSIHLLSNLFYVEEQFKVSVVCMQLETSEEIKQTLDQIQKQVSELQSTMQRIAAPNLKAIEK